MANTCISFGRRLGIAALVIATAAAPASAIVFDFNEQTPTAIAGSGSETGLLGALSSQAEGVALLVTRTVAGFDAAQIDSPDIFPPSWPPVVLDPLAFATTDDYFVGNFSEPMTSVSVSFTDFLQDEDLVTLEAFSDPDAGGTSIDFDSTVWPITSLSPDFVTLTVTGAAIRSIRFRGGSAGNPNSMYADNVVATPTPEPALDLALPAAAAALVSLRRGRTGRLGRSAGSR
jgi:hypothetical protein